MELQTFFRAVYDAGTHSHIAWLSDEVRPYNESDEFKGRLLLGLYAAPVDELVALTKELATVGLVSPDLVTVWDLGDEYWQRESVQKTPDWIELFVRIIADAAYQEWSWCVEDRVEDIDHLIRLQSEHIYRCRTSEKTADAAEARSAAEQLVGYDISSASILVLLQQLVLYYPEYGRKTLDRSFWCITIQELAQQALIEFLVAEYIRTLD